MNEVENEIIMFMYLLLKVLINNVTQNAWWSCLTRC